MSKNKLIPLYSNYIFPKNLQISSLDPYYVLFHSYPNISALKKDYISYLFNLPNSRTPEKLIAILSNKNKVITDKIFIDLLTNNLQNTYPVKTLTKRTIGQLSAMHVAVLIGDMNLVRKIHNLTQNLLNSQDQAGFTPLHWANVLGDKKMAELLLDLGANKNIRNNILDKPKACEIGQNYSSNLKQKFIYFDGKDNINLLLPLSEVKPTPLYFKALWLQAVNNSENKDDFFHYDIAYEKMLALKEKEFLLKQPKLLLTEIKVDDMNHKLPNLGLGIYALENIPKGKILGFIPGEITAEKIIPGDKTFQIGINGPFENFHVRTNGLAGYFNSSLPNAYIAPPSWRKNLPIMPIISLGIKKGEQICLTYTLDENSKHIEIRPKATNKFINKYFSRTQTSEINSNKELSKLKTALRLQHIFSEN